MNNKETGREGRKAKEEMTTGGGIVLTMQMFELNGSVMGGRG